VVNNAIHEFKNLTVLDHPPEFFFENLVVDARKKL